MKLEFKFEYNIMFQFRINLFLKLSQYCPSLKRIHETTNTQRRTFVLFVWLIRRCLNKI